MNETEQMKREQLGDDIRCTAQELAGEYAAREDGNPPLAPRTCCAPTRGQLQQMVEKDLRNICSIYPSIGRAFYDEPEKRLIQRIAHTMWKAHNVAVSHRTNSKKS